MRSAEKTVKSSVARASNTALRPAKQLEVGKNRTKTVKHAGPTKTKGVKAESNGKAPAPKQKSAAQAKALKGALVRKSAKAAGALNAAKPASRSKVAEASSRAKPVAAAKASSRSKGSVAQAAKVTAKAPAAQAQKGKLAIEIVSAKPSVAAAKTVKPRAAAATASRAPSLKRGKASASLARPSKAALGKATRPVQAAEHAIVPKTDAAKAAVVDLLRASKRPLIGRAMTPGRAAASLNSIPDAVEQEIVTKKIEKRASVDSAADIGRVAASPAAEVVEAASSNPVTAATPAVARPAMESKPVEKTAAPVNKPAKAPNAARQGFKPNEFIVYPAHGVGQIVAVEEQEVAGFKLELFVISFIKDKMILKVPTPKVASVGMRKLADADVVKKALDTLAGRARIKRTMWSRRAQEYEAKINSGDLIAIAEVVRDLYRSDAQPEQSYSERQLYEAALDRMAREVVIVQKLTESESLKAIEAQLQKGPRRGKVEEIDSEETDADIEEAA